MNAVMNTSVRKSYNVNDVVNKMLPDIEEYAHGWLKVPSKSYGKQDNKVKYEVRVNLVTFQAASCTCSFFGKCIHMIASEAFYASKKDGLLFENIYTVYDTILKKNIDCRRSRLSTQEFEQIEHEERITRQSQYSYGEFYKDWHNFTFDANYLNDHDYLMKVY